MGRKAWEVGNLFAVPLADGSHVCGQVVGHEPQVLNSITCAFYRTRVPAGQPLSFQHLPGHSELIAVQFTTKDLLTRRVWKVVGNQPVTLPSQLFPHEDKRGQSWVGAVVVGSGNMVHFLNAFFGLEPWNQMKDPQYFDRLLLRPDLKPPELRFTA